MYWIGRAPKKLNSTHTSAGWLGAAKAIQPTITMNSSDVMHEKAKALTPTRRPHPATMPLAAKPIAVAVMA